MKIDKNIPIPELKGGDIKKALTTMKLGDSVFVKCSKIEGYRSKKANWYAAATTYGVKITIRDVKNGIRIWRVKVQ